MTKSSINNAESLSAGIGIDVVDISNFLSLTHTSQIAAAVVPLIPTDNKSDDSNVKRGSNP